MNLLPATPSESASHALGSAISSCDARCNEDQNRCGGVVKPVRTAFSCAEPTRDHQRSSALAGTNESRREGSRKHEYRLTIRRRTPKCLQDTDETICCEKLLDFLLRVRVHPTELRTIPPLP